MKADEEGVPGDAAAKEAGPRTGEGVSLGSAEGGAGAKPPQAGVRHQARAHGQQRLVLRMAWP